MTYFDVLIPLTCIYFLILIYNYIKIKSNGFFDGLVASVGTVILAIVFYLCVPTLGDGYQESVKYTTVRTGYNKFTNKMYAELENTNVITLEYVPSFYEKSFNIGDTVTIYKNIQYNYYGMEKPSHTTYTLKPKYKRK